MYKYTAEDIPPCIECKEGRINKHFWLPGLVHHPKYKYGFVKCSKCGSLFWIVVNKKTDEIRLIQKVHTCLDD